MAIFSRDYDDSLDSDDDRPIALTNRSSRKRQRSPTPTERTGTLLDLDVTDCPICFHPLTIPIFQCDNGHIICSTCCEKLSQKCATCSLPTLSRNRAMEQVVELLRVPCPNAGCSKIVSCSETSAHVNLCPFTQRTCPFRGCDFTCSSKDLYKHAVDEHSLDAPRFTDVRRFFSSRKFKCGTPETLYLATDKRIILKERTTGEGEGEIVVVEWFDVPDGRIFYACCIGPGTGKFSYQLKISSVHGDELLFNSNLQRVREVSNEPPRARFMLAPSCMLLPYNDYSICIKRETN
ncbi:Seven-in-absentia protein [Hirschfeldia incana]|nr:Seven-in-absentia protein [Hirschfeldia incana]